MVEKQSKIRSTLLNPPLRYAQGRRQKQKQKQVQEQGKSKIKIKMDPSLRWDDD